jgi:hypothetical protein
MTLSIGGTATPVMGGGAGQAGGELLKGLGAFGNMVRTSPFVGDSTVSNPLLSF